MGNAELEVTSLLKEEEKKQDKEREGKLLWDRNYLISEQDKDDVLNKVKQKI